VDGLFTFLPQCWCLEYRRVGGGLVWGKVYRFFTSVA
jgi:hypothetical protein